MRLDVNDEDVQVLREVLTSVVSDLSPEIADTDNFEYRNALKGRRDRLRAILENLGGPVAPADT
jgi:hypothetical protein